MGTGWEHSLASLRTQHPILQPRSITKSHLAPMKTILSSENLFTPPFQACTARTNAPGFPGDLKAIFTLLCSPSGTSNGMAPRPKTCEDVLASHFTVTCYPDRSSLNTVRIRRTSWPVRISGLTTGHSPFLLLAALSRSNSRSATATGA